MAVEALRQALSSLDERDDRWRRVRAAMAAARMDLLIAVPQALPADALYLAGELGAVIFPLEGEPHIILGGENSHLAVEREGWIASRSTATPHGSSKVEYGKVVADAISPSLARGRVGVVGLDGNPYTNVRSPEGYLAHRTAARILAAVGDAEVVDGGRVLAMARHQRTSAEVAAFRAAAVVAEAAARSVGDALVVGAPQAEAYRAGVVAMLQPHVTEMNLAWSPGSWGSPRPRLATTPPGLVSPDLCVALEAFPGVFGYVAQVAQPLLATPPSPEQLEAFALNVSAFDATLAALRPGASWRDVRRAAEAVASGSGWRVTFLVHGGPDGPLFIPNEENDEVIDAEVREGAVLTCKPHVHPANQPYIARSHDMAWGDTVVVTATGAERLGTRAMVPTVATERTVA